MIRLCRADEIDTIYNIINDSSMVYKGVIPSDRWKEPYMPMEELQAEIANGVVFWGCELGGELVGVMGIQNVGDVTLIRHAYIRTDMRNNGMGGKLLAFLRSRADRPILIGTWKDAAWAVRFYEKNGFRTVTPAEKDRLLKQYWTIPRRQVETSVVLVEAEPTIEGRVI